MAAIKVDLLHVQVRLTGCISLGSSSQCQSSVGTRSRVNLKWAHEQGAQAHLLGVMICWVAFRPDSSSATPPQALGLAMLVPAQMHGRSG